jgi:protein-L-isoaspartate(D-aspartate) O-methyltransferase
MSGETDDHEAERRSERVEMVELQIARRGISDRRVLAAMRKVPRHRFVPPEQQPFAYDDGPLPIGYSQTISQPYIVALMTELARPKPGDRALDIGTGSGYQAAILAALVEEVDSIEIIEPLARRATKTLAELGITNVHVKHGDGYEGWPDLAPFDIILLAAAPEQIPPPLVSQLGPGGRLVLPVGRFKQELLLIERLEGGEIRESRITPVAFVPMTGKAEELGPIG